MPTKINDNWIDISDSVSEERDNHSLISTEPVELDFVDTYLENITTDMKPSNSETLKNESKKLMEQIITEQDPDKIKDLSALFDMNQRKKDMARMDRLSNIAELVDDEVLLRLSTSPGSIADKDLSSYMKNVQSAISSTKQSMSNTPLIQVNNNNIEIHNNTSGLDQASRKRVQEAVMAILNGATIEDLEEVEECEET